MGMGGGGMGMGGGGLGMGGLGMGGMCPHARALRAQQTNLLFAEKRAAQAIKSQKIAKVSAVKANILRRKAAYSASAGWAAQRRAVASAAWMRSRSALQMGLIKGETKRQTRAIVKTGAALTKQTAFRAARATSNVLRRGMMQRSFWNTQAARYLAGANRNMAKSVKAQGIQRISAAACRRHAAAACGIQLQMEQRAAMERARLAATSIAATTAAAKASRAMALGGMGMGFRGGLGGGLGLMGAGGIGAGGMGGGCGGGMWGAGVQPMMMRGLGGPTVPMSTLDVTTNASDATKGDDVPSTEERSADQENASLLQGGSSFSNVEEPAAALNSDTEFGTGLASALALDGDLSKPDADTF